MRALRAEGADARFGDADLLHPYRDAADHSGEFRRRKLAEQIEAARDHSGSEREQGRPAPRTESATEQHTA